MTDETISSMVQDVTHHRETEIRIITGAVCRLGREHGIPTPCNDLMLQLVLAKQSIYRGREKSRAALCRGKRRKAARAACAHMNSCKKRQLAVDSFLNERAADWYICRPPLL